MADFAHDGRIAEFKCCALLESWGIRTIHMDESGYDILADGSFGLLRIQCKSSSIKHFNNARWDAKHWNGQKNHAPYSRKDADVFALYWRPLDKFVFLPIPTDNLKRTLSFPIIAIHTYDQRLGFDAARRAVIILFSELPTRSQEVFAKQPDPPKQSDLFT